MITAHIHLPYDDIDSPEAAIDFIRNDTHENIYVFKNNLQILRFRGETNQVTIENMYIPDFKDGIIVHNHPQGSPFSETDVANAIQFDVAVFILVTFNFVYKIERPANGWQINWYESSNQKIFESCKFIAKNSIDKLVAKNEIASYEGEIEYNHYIWMLYFQIKNIPYVRKAHTK